MQYDPLKEGLKNDKITSCSRIAHINAHIMPEGITQYERDRPEGITQYERDRPEGITQL